MPEGQEWNNYLTIENEVSHTGLAVYKRPSVLYFSPYTISVSTTALVDKNHVILFTVENFNFRTRFA